MKKKGEVAPKVNMDSPTINNTSSGFHLLEFHVSNIVVLGSCACQTAAGVVFLYRHISKKRRGNETRLLEAARVEPELGMIPQSHRINMNPTWSPGGPRPKNCLPRRRKYRPRRVTILSGYGKTAGIPMRGGAHDGDVGGQHGIIQAPNDARNGGPSESCQTQSRRQARCSHHGKLGKTKC